MSSLKTLFITGGSGFIGSRLLQEIDPADFKLIYCLTRKGMPSEFQKSKTDNIHFVKGDLLDPKIYEPYISASDIVVHLAAVTGKARAESYFRTNDLGTQVLVKQCEKFNVAHFLYVSSIAAKFLDISNYPYALSKKQGEDAVTSSHLNYTILRPTIVIGKDSGTWDGLVRLSKGPLFLVFGDGKARIQPIYVDDLADCILSIITRGLFFNKIIELGGPEDISIENFQRQIRRVYYSDAPRAVHIPLKFLIPVLRFSEKFLLPVLPFTAGQLSSFRYDGTTDNHGPFLDCQLNMASIEQMVTDVASEEQNEIRRWALIRECKTFSAYLVNQTPSLYIQEKYIDAHKKRAYDLQYAMSPFDRMIIKAARLSPFVTKLVDIYSRYFLRYSVFRKKLVLLLAILENSAPYHTYFDSANCSNKALLIIKIFWRVSCFPFFLLVSIPILGPLHIGSMIFARIAHRSKKQWAK